jgi:hypothetical protein
MGTRGLLEGFVGKPGKKRAVGWIRSSSEDNAPIEVDAIEF